MSQYRKPDQLIEELDYQNRLLVDENKRLREALEEIANGKPPKSIYGEGIYWWCVETAKKALEHNDE